MKKDDKEDVSFFDVTIWNKPAENCAKFLSKGKKIGVNGRLKQERWQSDDKTHSKVGIVASSIQFLDPMEKNKNDSYSNEESPY